VVYSLRGDAVFVLRIHGAQQWPKRTSGNDGQCPTAAAAFMAIAASWFL
jgi:hypothetical protein